MNLDDYTPLDAVREWLGRFILTTTDADLDLLALWAAHTHVVNETYTTPRLLLDSPLPGSGKTTCLEHLGRMGLPSPLTNRSDCSKGANRAASANSSRGSNGTNGSLQTPQTEPCRFHGKTDTPGCYSCDRAHGREVGR